MEQEIRLEKKKRQPTKVKMKGLMVWKSIPKTA
jgi:hypothetical protein